MREKIWSALNALFAKNVGETFAACDRQWAILRFCGGIQLYDLCNGQVVKLENLLMWELLQIVKQLENRASVREKAE